jgi:hypothetical protein
MHLNNLTTFLAICESCGIVAILTALNLPLTVQISWPEKIKTNGQKSNADENKRSRRIWSSNQYHWSAIWKRLHDGRPQKQRAKWRLATALELLKTKLSWKAFTKNPIIEIEEAEFCQNLRLKFLRNWRSRPLQGIFYQRLSLSRTQINKSRSFTARFSLIRIVNPDTTNKIAIYFSDHGFYFIFKKNMFPEHLQNLLK